MKGRAYPSVRQASLCGFSFPSFCQTWGLALIAIGARRGSGWWVATGIAVLAIGVVFFAGSSLVSPFLWRPPLLLMNLVFAGLVHAAWGPVC